MHPTILTRQPRHSRAHSDVIDAAISASEELPGAAFKIFTGLLTASLGEDGAMRLHGVASSTTRDLHGDVMTESALEDMERAANGNLTIFLNHSYNVPEDVAGSCVKAVMIRRGVDGDGNPNYDLDFDIVINQENERAVKAFRSIKAGTKLGLSIGAMIPDGGAVRDKKSGALTINHVNLLETSIVSIPANPRSWVDRATGASKALLKAWREQGPLDVEKSTHQLGSPTLTLAGDTYQISGSLNGLKLGTEPDLEASADPTVVDAAPVEDPTPAITDGVEPDVQDSRVRIIEIDTDSPSAADSSSQEGTSADPEAEEDEWSATPATTASVEPDVELATQLEAMPDALRGVFLAMANQATGGATALLTVLRELETERALRTDAERVRDEVVLSAGAAMQQMNALIQRLADTPMGRKASFKSIADDFDGLAAKGIYSEAFLKLASGR